MAGPTAIVDIGSNTVRLFLCDPGARGGPAGQRYATITGLRRGADPERGTLAPDALARLDRCLADFGARVRAAGVRRGVALGTSAVRDAPNRAQAAAIVGRRLGLPLTVLPGEREAELAFTGARLGTAEAGPVLVLDVGGGSTELVRGDAYGLQGAVSLQIGAVRCTEAALHIDPPDPAELAALREDLSVRLGVAVQDAGGPAPMIGVAGTVTTIAAVHAGGYHPDVVHGMTLTAEDVEATLRSLAALPLEERRAVRGLEAARAPVIVAGIAIVAEAMRAADAPALLVSERDLLDGAALRADTLCTALDWDRNAGGRLREPVGME